MNASKQRFCGCQYSKCQRSFYHGQRIGGKMAMILSNPSQWLQSHKSIVLARLPRMLEKTRAGVWEASLRNWEISLRKAL